MSNRNPDSRPDVGCLKQRGLLTLGILASLIVAPNAEAQAIVRADAAPVGASISIDDIVTRALRDNPDVRISKAASDAARGAAIGRLAAVP